MFDACLVKVVYGELRATLCRLLQEVDDSVSLLEA